MMLQKRHTKLKEYLKQIADNTISYQKALENNTSTDAVLYLIMCRNSY